MASIMSLFGRLLFLAYYTGKLADARGKRLVLHTDQDDLNVISTLQSKVNSLELEVSKLKLHNDPDVTATFQAKLNRLESEISQLKSNNLAASTSTGSVYVRWGRTSCPGNGTEFVFSGRMAGNKWNGHGGGSNSICLPNDPTWGKYVDGPDAGSSVYGTEIDDFDSNANILFGKSVYNEDIPCSVCRTSRPSNVMISGRVNCYPGWTLEYQGYVISSLDGFNNNADYACLDAGLEFAPHGAADDNEHRVTVVEVSCGTGGSLPCPPYVNGRELACVVCSK